VNDFTMLEVTLSVFLFFHHFSFLPANGNPPGFNTRPGLFDEGERFSMVLSIFSARDFEGFHCFNPWPPPAAVSVTGVLAAAMLEPFASGEAFFPGSEPVSGASRSHGVPWRWFLPWGHSSCNMVHLSFFFESLILERRGFDTVLTGE
jgi:hypothetical protein